MLRILKTLFCLVILLSGAVAIADQHKGSDNSLLRFHGICDGSAAVELSDGQLLVSYDESNAWYRFNATGGHYLQSIDYRRQLGFKRKAEADLEAVATVGDDIWWLGSHGRDGDGDIAINRRSLFRTTRSEPANVASDAIDVLRLFGRDLFPAQALLRKPDKGGVNFEGLAGTADGALMIGVRSPLSRGNSGRAMVIEWQPQTTTADVHWLDIDNRGIRALARFQKGFLLVAGGAKSRGKFSLYYWVPGADPVVLPILDKRLRAEAIVTTGGGGVLILSDDGKVKRGDKSAKKGKRTCDRIRRKNPAADQHPNVYFRAQAISADELRAAISAATD